MKYCIYLRKSRADLEAESCGEMETLARHEKVLLELAKRSGFAITEIYKEIVSGELIATRPAVQRLLDEVERGEWSGVLVMEIERLARGDTIDQGIVARAFKNGNAKIITPLKVYDPNNEFDEEYFEFGLFMSRREYKTINRRIQRGRVESAKEGKAIISTPPYGYRKVRVPDGKGFTLAPDEEEAEAVRLIYTLYADGVGMTVIAGRLDALGIRPRISAYWSKATISDILKNPVYIGKIRWSYYTEKKINTGSGSTKKRVRNDDYLLADGLHPPLISEELFGKAQQTRKDNTYKRVNKDLSLKNPLSGLVYCKKCGALMSRLGPNHHTPYDTLRCLNKYCDNISAPLSLVEDYLLRSLGEWLHEHKFQLRRDPEADKREQSDRLKLIAKTLKRLRADLSRIEKQISNTYDLLEEGVYTVEVFTQRNKELATRRDDINQRIKESEIEEQQWRSRIAVREQTIPLFQDVINKYQTISSAEIKNRLLKGVVSRAEYIKTEPNRRGQANNGNFRIEVFPNLPQEIYSP